MAFSLGFSLTLGGEAPVIVSVQAVFPSSIYEEQHGFRFSNAPPDQSDALDSVGIVLARYSSIAPSAGTHVTDGSSISGVVGRRFMRKFSTTTLAVISPDERNTNAFGIKRYT